MPLDNVEAIRAAYEADGVVRLRGLLSAEQLSEARSQIQRYEREVAPGLGEADRVYEADGRTLRNLWRMHEHDDYFAALARQDRLFALAAALLGPEPGVVAVETFNKPARVGSAVPYHQDNAYFCYTPADVFTLWIAIDPATEENGAVQYLKGSHRRPLPHTASGVAGNSMGLAEEPDAAGCEPFLGTLEPGDALAHHCQVLHRSEPNRSQQSRLGLLMVYRGAHTRHDPQMKAHYEAAPKG